MLCMLTGEIILYAFGLAGLWLWLGEKATILTTLKYGLFPFIIGDTLKAFMAAALFPYLASLLDFLLADLEGHAPSGNDRRRGNDWRGWPDHPEWKENAQSVC